MFVTKFVATKSTLPAHVFGDNETKFNQKWENFIFAMMLLYFKHFFLLHIFLFGPHFFILPEQ